MGKILTIIGADFSAVKVEKVTPSSGVMITVLAEPTEGGTVTGGGQYEIGSTATLTATAASGYNFNGWSDGNGDNPRTVNVGRYGKTYTAEFEDVSKHTLTAEEAGWVASIGFFSGNSGTSAGECYARIGTVEARSLCVIDMNYLRTSGYKTLSIKSPLGTLAGLVTNSILTTTASTDRSAFKLDKDAADGTISSSFNFVSSYNIDMVNSDSKDYQYLYLQIYGTPQTTGNYTGDWAIVASM